MNRSDSHPILDVRKLTTRLKVGREIWTPVDRLSFSLYPGKTLALVGESGCGKSLTALSLMRILPTPPALPSTGEVFYNRRDLLTLSESEMRKIRGGKIAMIFQDPGSALNPVYTIENQLIEAAELHLKIYGQEARIRAEEVLREVGIPDPDRCLSAYPHELSGGLKQRVMIAGALIGEPDILIADEPTTALDVTTQAQVLKLIRRLQKERNMALLLITHDMGVVSEMADDVIVMYMAQGIERGFGREFFDFPLHPYTIGLFNSLPSLDSIGEKLRPVRGRVPSLRHIPSGCRFHPRCDYAMEKCRRGIIPDLTPEGSSGIVRCLLYDGTPESEEKKSMPNDGNLE